MPSFACILFDLDGTLLDSLKDLANCMNAVLARSCFAPHPVDSYRYFVGDGMEKLAQRVLPPEHQDEAAVSACVSAMRHEYGRRWAENTTPYAGIPELLNALQKTGIKKGIFSNKPDDFTREITRTLLPHWHFDFVVGARPGVPKKPDPAGALEIASRLGLPPQRFVYVGDTNTDMQTARAAGMYPAGALWGFRSAAELTGSGAALLLEKPTDLLLYLNKNGNTGKKPLG